MKIYIGRQKCKSNRKALSLPPAHQLWPLNWLCFGFVSENNNNDDNNNNIVLMGV